MVLLIYSGLLLITGVQIKAFNEASDEVLTSWIPPGARGIRRRLAGALPVYSYSPVMKCLYAAAWSPGRKNRLKMMSSSKSFLALSFHLMPGAVLSHSPRSRKSLGFTLPAGPMQFLWPYCFFTMVIVLNQFINLQQPSGLLPSKIKSRSFHHCTLAHWDGKVGGKKRHPPLLHNNPPHLSATIPPPPGSPSQL